MKRFAVIPAFLVFCFLPVFALQAEKIAQPLPAPRVIHSANAEIVLSNPALRTTLVTVRYPETSGPRPTLVADCGTASAPVWESVSSEGVRTQLVPVAFSGTCDRASVSVALAHSGKTVPGSGFSLPVLSDEAAFVRFSDLSDEALFLFARDSSAQAAAIRALPDSVAVPGAGGSVSSSVSAKARLEKLVRSYRAAALEYRSRKAAAVSEARKNLRYLVPVAGTAMPENYPYIPNGGRPYRKDTTDGIHHGWDLLAPVGTPVRAVADGVVVRVVSGFAWRDFDRLSKGPNLSEDRKALNLDVFRGNQVWLKTADGNVTFYSHLSAIAPDVAVGRAVVAGEILGNVGITGVPDKGYSNPHLHFEIQRNPHDGSDSSDPLAVMRWDWLAKGLGKDKTLSLAEASFRTN